MGSPRFQVESSLGPPHHMALQALGVLQRAEAPRNGPAPPCPGRDRVASSSQGFSNTQAEFCLSSSTALSSHLSSLGRRRPRPLRAHVHSGPRPLGPTATRAHGHSGPTVYTGSRHRATEDSSAPQPSADRPVWPRDPPSCRWPQLPEPLLPTELDVRAGPEPGRAGTALPRPGHIARSGGAEARLRASGRGQAERLRIGQSHSLQSGHVPASRPQRHARVTAPEQAQGSPGRGAQRVSIDL